MKWDVQRILDLASRCHPRGRSPSELEPLTWSERREIAEILSEFAEERLTPKNPKHRPRKDADRKRYAVVDILLDINRGVPPDAAKEAAEVRWDLSGNQIKHALDDYRTDAEDIIATTSSKEGLAKVCEWHRGRK